MTSRANSALPLVEDVPLDDLLPVVEDFYDARLLPPRVQVSTPALDAELDARGWTASGLVDVLVGPLPTARSDAVVDGLDDAWVDCWWEVDGRGGPEERAVAVSMLELVRPEVGYARVVRDGVVVGVARGVAQPPWLGVFQVAVLPSARRTGVATDLLRALEAWGDARGCWSAYLQVTRENPGRGLYAGMQVSGSYRYRTRPASQSPLLS